MNVTHMARTAYASPTAPIRTPRSIEYDLFARITARLKAAGDEGRKGFPALVSALHDNRQLWTTLAADLSAPENALPEGLRAQLFYLAEFTLQHSGKVLDGSADAEVLVDINTAIMRGLRQPEAAA